MGKGDRRRHRRAARQPCQAKDFKDIVRAADLHRPDHATPLMLAAMAGNARLMEALPTKRADCARLDEFGHAAGDQAAGRAMREAAFAVSGLPALFDVLAPPAPDLQTGGRLVRLGRHQGEGWPAPSCTAATSRRGARGCARKTATTSRNP